MIRTVLVLAASRLIRDGGDNRVSAIDILDDFVAQGFPIVFPRTSLLWVLERDEGDPTEAAGTLTLTLDGVQIQQFPVQINFMDQTRTRSMLVIAGMIVQAPGRLTFTFRRDGIDQPDGIYSIRIAGGAAVAEEQPGPVAHGIVM